jgi:hypothetical protein
MIQLMSTQQNALGQSANKSLSWENDIFSGLYSRDVPPHGGRGPTTDVVRTSKLAQNSIKISVLLTGLQNYRPVARSSKGIGSP